LLLLRSGSGRINGQEPRRTLCVGGLQLRKTPPVAGPVIVAAFLGLLLAPSAWGYMPLDQPVTPDNDNPFRYSLALAPHFGWPHMNKLNDSLSFSGNEFTNKVYSYANKDGVRQVSGFKNISMDYGGQIVIAHEFEDDIRAGIVFATTVASVNETLKLTSALSATNGTPSGYWSSTDYSVSQSMSLPLFQIGVFWQRLFRFDEEPNMKLYMGGWGNFGTLFSASLKGKASITNILPTTDYAYDASLPGISGGGGGGGGVEYTFADHFSAYLETGWDYFIIHNIDRSGTVKEEYHYTDSTGAEVSRIVSTSNSNLQQWKDGNDNSIPLDYGGVFIRFGIRMGLF